MKPTVYIETTIPSLLTAWPSRDVETAAQQIATRERWDTRREDFELYVSPEVLSEARKAMPKPPAFGSKPLQHSRCWL